MSNLEQFEDRTLLIVDDDEPFLGRLARAMETRGFDVMTAASVRDGVATAKSTPPAFAVLDLRLADGTVGHGWCQGRDRKQAETAALLDALLQGPDAARLEAAVLKPLRDARTERRRSHSERAAATKVDFFTMARGDG